MVLDNADLVLHGHACVLVPYRPEHVPVYHEWMGDPELLETTASERLTLEQEYVNCRSWREDAAKCTFIILDRALPDTPGTGVHGGGMAGDVNIFLNDPDDSAAAELEIMVAERRSRRRGIAREALGLMMRYAAVRLGVRLYRAKIGMENAPSLALFAVLGFQEVSSSTVFREVTLEWRPDSLELQRWAEPGMLRCSSYDGHGGAQAAANGLPRGGGGVGEKGAEPA